MIPTVYQEIFSGRSLNIVASPELIVEEVGSLREVTSLTAKKEETIALKWIALKGRRILRRCSPNGPTCPS